MPRYRRKPTEITAVRFEVAGEWPPSVALHEGQHAVYNQLHASWIKLKPGDYIRIDDPADNYPIDAETFASTYELIDQPTEGENTDGT